MPARVPRRHALRRHLMVALVLLCGARAVRAQHALVLSGGGARGLTHAGAIVALEELGYSPPLIVGTSMGAIVGALYAAGYEPREIWSIIAAENWLEHFAAEPVLVGPRRSVRRPQVTFGMGGDRTYQGLLPTTGVNRRLVELLFDAGARARNDFDRLPRRFRAVTGDLATGEEFVIGAGDLPRAVRASMAVPGAFAPVRWDDRVLVDGGIANNLPVSVAIETRGRPVLAIDVLRPRPDLPERSAADIGIRSLRLLIENARPDTAARADILVLPPLRPGFSEVGFPADATSLLRTGYAAVHAQVPPVVPRQPHARRTPHLAPRLISGLRVEHADRATARLVRRMMRPTLGEYDVPELLRRTRALYATGLFHAVWPRLEFPDGEQEPALLSVEVSPVDPLTFAGAARWDDDLGAGAWLALRRRISLITPIELRVAGDFNELGERGSADVSVFSTLLPGVTWNVGGHASDVRVRDVVGDSVTALAEVRRSGAWAGAELHGPVRDWFVSLLARGDHIRGAGLGGWAVGPFLRVAAPPRPDRVVGIEPLIEAEQRFGDHEYRRGLVRIGTQTRVGRVQLGAFGSVESATRAAPLDALPSITRDLAPWLRVGALRSHRLGAAGIDVAHPLILNGYVRARGRLVGTAGDPAADRDDDWLVGGDVGAIWPTVIGPIAVGVAFGQHAHWGVNFSLGSTF